MSNHIHLVVRAKDGEVLSNIIRDLKKFTSKSIINEIKECNESRSVWLLRKFAFAGGLKYGKDSHKLWQDGYHAIELDNANILDQKIGYIHNNPVRAEIVAEPEHYIFSSATDYSGQKGLVKIELV
jgi:REP element-mobilizing transposase RayT